MPSPTSSSGRSGSGFHGSSSTPARTRAAGEKPVSGKSLLDRIVAILTCPRAMVRLGDYYGPEPRKLFFEPVQKLVTPAPAPTAALPPPPKPAAALPPPAKSAAALPPPAKSVAPKILI